MGGGMVGARTPKKVEIFGKNSFYTLVVISIKKKEIIFLYFSSFFYLLPPKKWFFGVVDVVRQAVDVVALLKEVIWSATGDVGFAASRGRVKLKEGVFQCVV